MDRTAHTWIARQEARCCAEEEGQASAVSLGLGTRWSHRPGPECTSVLLSRRSAGP